MPNYVTCVSGECKKGNPEIYYTQLGHFESGAAICSSIAQTPEADLTAAMCSGKAQTPEADLVAAHTWEVGKRSQLYSPNSLRGPCCSVTVAKSRSYKAS